MDRRHFLLLTGALVGSVALKPAIAKAYIRIVVISDLNSQYGATDYEPEVDKALAMIPQWQPDLVLCGGDMVAGQKTSLTPSQIQAMWSAFDQHISQPLKKAKIPFAFTVGNHDASGAQSQGQYIFSQERELARAYWKNPRHTPNLNFIDRGNFPFYYSFFHKGIFYLVWDASTHLLGNQQLAWVEKSLGSAIARKAKMKIVIGHLPLYGIAKGREKPGDFLANGEQLRGLLERYRVHTYISGHAHAYYPAKRGQLELLHTGALGSGPRQLLDSTLTPGKTLTILDIDIDAATAMYTSYDMKTLKVIDIKTLPPFIVAHNGQVFRRDLAPKTIN